MNEKQKAKDAALKAKVAAQLPALLQDAARSVGASEEEAGVLRTAANKVFAANAPKG